MTVAAKAPAKKRSAAPKFGEYRTDGKRLVRILGSGSDGKTSVEDAQTLEWEEIMTAQLQTWKVVREAEASGGE